MAGNICLEIPSSREDNGPHRNSAQATAEIPRTSFEESHWFILDSSGDPICRAATRKFASVRLLAPSVTHCIHPLLGFRIVESETFLECVKGFNRA